jgi:hypothetical protein
MEFPIFETIGAERMLFGTDSEWFPRGFAMRYFEAQWQAAEISRPAGISRAIIGSR